MKTVLLTVAACFAALAAQVPGSTNRYSATTGDVALTAAGTTFTIQQTTGSTKQITLESALVSCSVACNITQAANGTAATSTAGTIVEIPTSVAPLASKAAVWTASNVGAGTAIGGTVKLTAAGTAVLCYSTQCGASANVVLRTTGTGSNYSVTISTITGTANITFFWAER